MLICWQMWSELGSVCFRFVPTFGYWKLSRQRFQMVIFGRGHEWRVSLRSVWFQSTSALRQQFRHKGRRAGNETSQPFCPWVEANQITKKVLLKSRITLTPPRPRSVRGQKYVSHRRIAAKASSLVIVDFVCEAFYWKLNSISTLQQCIGFDWSNFRGLWESMHLTTRILCISREITPEFSSWRTGSNWLAAECGPRLTHMKYG